MRAWRVELHRISSRRLFAALAAALFAIFVIVSVVVFFDSSRDVGRARVDAERNVAECRRAEAAAPPGEDFGCPTVDQAMADNDPRFRYADSMPETARGFIGLLMAVAFLVGASSVAAEWSAGTMTTTLTWEPRRDRVASAKISTVAAVCGAGGLLALALLSVMLLPAGAFRGTLDGMTAGAWGELASIWARGGLIAAFGAAAGAGVAFITRNTAGALGGAFVVMGVLSPVAGAWRHGRLLPWVLHANIAEFVGASVTRTDESGTVFTSQALLRPTLVLLAYGVVLVGAGYASFRARDVT